MDLHDTSAEFCAANIPLLRPLSLQRCPLLSSEGHIYAQFGRSLQWYGGNQEPSTNMACTSLSDARLPHIGLHNVIMSLRAYPHLEAGLCQAGAKDDMAMYSPKNNS